MTLHHRQRSRLPVVLTLLVASGIAGALAVPDATLGHEADGRPARIHEGACGTLGRVVYRLTGVGAEFDLGGTPVPPPEIVGSEDASPITVGVTTIGAKMADLVKTPHAIVVYESDEAMDQMLVCGAVGGAMMMQMPGMAMPGDELAVWLAPQGGSAYRAVALLRSEVGGATRVTVMLAEGLAGGVTPGATPASG